MNWVREAVQRFSTDSPIWPTRALDVEASPLDVWSLRARTLILTALAMFAFAGNSLLCRAALKQTAIDPASLTFIRIFSGAATLWFLVQLPQPLAMVSQAPPTHINTGGQRIEGNWISGFTLFAYAAGFSFAYINLSAGTGALLLFGAVQGTMITWGVCKGERLHLVQVLGLVLALVGLIVLVFPGMSAPPIISSVLMVTAGAAWGIYSLRGKGETNPVRTTTGNFLRAVPWAALLSISLFPWMRLDRLGIACAIVSGAITSGLGYVVWYTALPSLTAMSAATVQLSVPLLAASAGILLLGEPINLRYIIACITVLGGIAMVLVKKQPA